MSKKKKKKKKKSHELEERTNLNIVDNNEEQDEVINDKENKVRELAEKVEALQATIQKLVPPAKTTPDIEYKHCPGCNSLNRLNAKFCKTCGFNLLSKIPVPQSTDIQIKIPDSSITSRISDSKEQEIPETVDKEITLPASSVISSIDSKEKDLIKMLPCPKCTCDNRENAKFCKTCGENLKDIIICNKCNVRNRSNAKFCKVCGEKFSKEAIPDQSAITEKPLNISEIILPVITNIEKDPEK
ncbi:MAG: zinc ribbon domain-containing protein, partial [Candidatus Eremiobacterota bacterium]